VPYDDTQRLFEENRELERLNNDLANSRFQDLVVAFGGGAFSFVLVFAIVRTGRNMRAESSNLPHVVQDEQQGLIQAIEVE
jgi:isopentenyl phosphate kinase